MTQCWDGLLLRSKNVTILFRLTKNFMLRGLTRKWCTICSGSRLQRFPFAGHDTAVELDTGVQENKIIDRRWHSEGDVSLLPLLLPPPQQPLVLALRGLYRELRTPCLCKRSVFGIRVAWKQPTDTAPLRLAARALCVLADRATATYEASSSCLYTKSCRAAATRTTETNEAGSGKPIDRSIESGRPHNTSSGERVIMKRNFTFAHSYTASMCNFSFSVPLASFDATVNQPERTERAM
jgi:hypothetical protein